MMAVRLPPGSLRPYLIVTAIFMLQAIIKILLPVRKSYLLSVRGRFDIRLIVGYNNQRRAKA